jgi:hypothetical protein
VRVAGELELGRIEHLQACRARLLSWYGERYAYQPIRRLMNDATSVADAERHTPFLGDRSCPGSRTTGLGFSVAGEVTNRSQPALFETTSLRNHSR